MAITWQTQIVIVDVAEKRVQITATRTDSADPDNPSTYSGATHLNPIGGETLGEMRDRLAQHLYGLYEADVAAESAAQAVISTYESELNTALDALET